METISKIRRQILRGEKSIRQVSRETGISRNTIKKYLQDSSPPEYKRSKPPVLHTLAPYKDQLEQWYKQDLLLPVRERRTGFKLYEQLIPQGYKGAYCTVARYLKKIRATKSSSSAFVPLCFDPGDAMQFDFSHEVVVLDGIEQTVKVAHFRLSHSRQSFVIAYHRESLEMILDAFAQAIEFYQGVPRRVIIDNPKTMVSKIFKGKERPFNPRFLAMANHYLIEPVACTPAAGWEKGQVENQVRNIRGNFFTPKLHFASLAELNVYLHASCIKLADNAHPEFKDISIKECFESEKPYLQAPIQAFDGYVDTTTSVNSTCQVQHDTNCYSVPYNYVGKVVTLLIYARCIKILCAGKLIAQHARSFKRHTCIYNPWHYIPLLMRKPGALRNGAPFKDFHLPAALKLIQQKYQQQDGGDKEFIKLLMLAVNNDLETLVCACELAVEEKTYQLSAITNILYRLIDGDRYTPIDAAAYPILKHPPIADCKRYDGLLGGMSCSN
jgi:transposase